MKPAAKMLPQKLAEGYRDFLSACRGAPQLHRRLASDGQKPEIMVIGCCDSRAAPEIIFQTAPGDIFVTRNIANQVPPFQPDGHFHGTSAALEYAVKALKVKHILVLGHSGCGGAQAALAAGAAQAGAKAGAGSGPKRGRPAAAATGQAARYDFISDWLALLKPAAEAAAAAPPLPPAARARALEQLSLRFSLCNLRSFPWIKQAEEQGRLALYAAWFDIAATALWLLDEAEGRFFPLQPPA